APARASVGASPPAVARAPCRRADSGPTHPVRGPGGAAGDRSPGRRRARRRGGAGCTHPFSTLRPNVGLAISRQTAWRIRARIRPCRRVGSAILPHERTTPPRPALLAERLEPQRAPRSAGLQHVRPRAPRPVRGGARVAVADRALALPPHGNRDRALEPRRHDDRRRARPGELRRKDKGTGRRKSRKIWERSWKFRAAADAGKPRTLIAVTTAQGSWVHRPVDSPSRR